MIRKNWDKREDLRAAHRAEELGWSIVYSDKDVENHRQDLPHDSIGFKWNNIRIWYSGWNPETPWRAADIEDHKFVNHRSYESALAALLAEDKTRRRFLLKVEADHFGWSILKDSPLVLGDCRYYFSEDMTETGNIMWERDVHETTTLFNPRRQWWDKLLNRTRIRSFTFKWADLVSTYKEQHNQLWSRVCDFASERGICPHRVILYLIDTVELRNEVKK